MDIYITGNGATVRQELTEGIEKYLSGNPRADARLKQAFEVSAELGKSLEIRSNPDTRQMIIGVNNYPLLTEQTTGLKLAEKQNTAYELLYSFYFIYVYILNRHRH